MCSRSTIYYCNGPCYMIHIMPVCIWVCVYVDMYVLVHVHIGVERTYMSTQTDLYLPLQTNIVMT